MRHQSPERAKYPSMRAYRALTGLEVFARPDTQGVALGCHIAPPWG